MKQEDIERLFYEKHPNYKPYLRMLDYEGNEIKFCDILYDYHTHVKEMNDTKWCADCRTPNFCQHNIDKPCLTSIKV